MRSVKKIVKQLILPLLLTVSLVSTPRPASAQLLPVAEIIKAGVKKVIKAMDLKVQRLQNETIWLQNAQKTLENAMSKLKLQEISGWTQRQKELYGNYFQELSKVKTLISYYQQVKAISSTQLKAIKAYQNAWRLLKHDRNFSAAELLYMARVYTGILEASLKNLDQLTLVTSSFATSMTDRERLALIHQSKISMDQQYYDLLQFNRQNMLLSLSRTKDSNDALRIKNLYGLP